MFMRGSYVSLMLLNPAGSPVVRHWGHNLVSKVMNVFPGRAGQPPIPSIPAAQPSPAASQAAAMAPIQAAALTRCPPATTDQPADPYKGQARPQEGLPAAIPKPDRDAATALAEKALGPQMRSSAGDNHAPRPESKTAAGVHAADQPAQQDLTQHSAQGPLHHHPPVTAPVPEAALLANSPGRSSNPSQQQPAASSQSLAEPPSILQDLRNAAAQDSLHQASVSTSTPADSMPQHAAHHLMPPGCPALPDVPDSQETISMPAQRPSMAAQPGPVAASLQAARTQAQRLSTASQPVCLPIITPQPGAALPELKACSASPQGTAAVLSPPESVAPSAGQTSEPEASQGTMQSTVSRSKRLADKRAAAQQLHHKASTGTVLAASLSPKLSKQMAAKRQRLQDKKASDAQDMDRRPPSATSTAGMLLLPVSQSDHLLAAKGQGLSEEKLTVAQAAVLHDQDMLEASVKQTGLDLALKVEAANSAVPSVLAECLASNRSKRVPGGDPLEVGFSCAQLLTPPTPPWLSLCSCCSVSSVLACMVIWLQHDSACCLAYMLFIQGLSPSLAADKGTCLSKRHNVQPTSARLL